MTRPNEEQFIANVKKALDLGKEQIDPATQSKLAGIRRKALDAGERKGFDFRRWFTLPVAGWAATAALIVLGLTVYLQQPNGTVPPLEDIDLLAAEDNLEFYEGLEFYAWLAEEDIDAAG